MGTVERDGSGISVYGVTLDDKQIDQLVSDVRDKKELENFSEEYILRYARSLLAKNKKLREEFKNKALKKEYDKLIKDIREKARRIYGAFITKKYGQREQLLKEEKYGALLDLHVSTKERKKQYENIFSKLTQDTFVPGTILDLACGFNPIAAEILHTITEKRVTYIAVDLCEEDVAFLNRYFEQSDACSKNSRAFACDLSDENELKDIGLNADWCLLWKALEPLEESHENITYDLLKKIRARRIIASFSTLTLSRKRMNNPQRGWFEKVLKNLKLAYRTYEIGDEIFYVIVNE